MLGQSWSRVGLRIEDFRKPIVDVAGTSIQAFAPMVSSVSNLDMSATPRLPDFSAEVREIKKLVNCKE